MSESDRAQRLIERIQEDERLRGDLSDPAATALVAWAVKQVQRAAANLQHSDEQLEALAQAIRSAARGAARAGVDEASEVIARAEANLAQAEPAASAPPAADAPSAAPAPQAEPTDQPAQVQPSSVLAVAEAAAEAASSAATAVSQTVASADTGSKPARERPQRPPALSNRRRRPFRSGSSSGNTRKDG